jgi:hypothetical protein
VAEEGREGEQDETVLAEDTVEADPQDAIQGVGKMEAAVTLAVG